MTCQTRTNFLIGVGDQSKHIRRFKIVSRGVILYVNLFGKSDGLLFPFFLPIWVWAECLVLGQRPTRTCLVCILAARLFFIVVIKSDQRVDPVKRPGSRFYGSIWVNSVQSEKIKKELKF